MEVLLVPLSFLLVTIAFYSNICVGIDTTLFIDPSTFIHYKFGNNNSNNYESKFNYTKWCGHHALNETTIKSNLCKSVNTFASRWLNADTSYFELIPENGNKKGYANLTWFNNSQNINLVLGGYPQYLKEYNNYDNNMDLIYCLSGITWPSYMLNLTNDPNYLLPNNFEAATEIITSSLNVLYQQTGNLPKYFEPMNEPNNDAKFPSVPDIKKMQFQQYVINKVSKLFKNKGILVGGPVESGVEWMDLYNYNNTNNNNIRNTTMIWNETIKYFIENDINNTIDFISWHQFSDFSQNKKNGKWSPRFYGSGCVHSTFDLIESYTNSIHGKPTKILISEHGLAAKSEMETGDFNISYMQYIGAQTHLSDILNYLDRPESQYKSNSFLLTSNSSIREPILIIYSSNNTLTPTSIVYNVWTLIKENNGNKINTSIIYHDNNSKTETIKLHSYYNNNNNKLIIVLKEISWNDTNISIKINGFMENNNNNNYNNYNNNKFKILRIYWDVNKGEFIRINVTFDNLNNIYLHGGETMVIYDINYNYSYSLNATAASDVASSINNICRKRYYLTNFEIYNIEAIMDGYIMNISVNKQDIIYNAILRVGINWNTTQSTVKDIEPLNVKMDNHVLPLSLKRIDNLVKRPRVWTAFEYKIKSKDILTQTNSSQHTISLQFLSKVDYSYVTSIVCEVYTKC